MPAVMRAGERLRGQVLFILLAAVVSLATGLHASVAQAHPNGGTGHARGWKPQWTQYFNECFAKHGQALANSRPTDKQVFCSNANPSMSENDFWLSIYIPIARAESGFNAHATGRNGRKTPAGLFQMDATDMAFYQCEGKNPYDARQAICCAIKIGSYWAERGRSAISSGTQGILAEFFQPVRTGVGGNGRGGHVNNSRSYKKVVASSNRLCQYAPATGHPDLGASGGMISCTLPSMNAAEIWFSSLGEKT